MKGKDKGEEFDGGVLYVCETITVKPLCTTRIC
jgi:hypothetical protein